jgi:hypothetical protein
VPAVAPRFRGGYRLLTGRSGRPLRTEAATAVERTDAIGIGEPEHSLSDSTTAGPETDNSGTILVSVPFRDLILRT